MSTEEPAKKEKIEEAKGTPKTSKWTNISSDEDQEESNQSEKQQQSRPTMKKPTETKEAPAQILKEEMKRNEPNIVAFDPKKKFRGDKGPIKTIKGGFKAEKLEQKKFQLDTIKNPFDVQVESSEDEKEDNKPETEDKPAEETEKAIQQPVEVKESEQKSKNTKKSKKQKEKEELEELTKEFGIEQIKPEGEGKKKKKKNKAKKAEGETTQEEPKVQQVQAEKVQQFAVDRQQIQQVMRKKAAEAKTSGPKKVSGKSAVAANAKKAIVERENKNKSKKVYVDL